METLILSSLVEEHLNPPEERFSMTDWQNNPIYVGEDYIELDNGDVVLDTKETIIEYLSENYDFTKEMLTETATRKVAQ